MKSPPSTKSGVICCWPGRGMTFQRRPRRNSGRLSRSGLHVGGAGSGDIMSQSPDPQRHLCGVLETACAALDRAGIPYAVAGGIAAGFWGEARTTIDVDLVVAASPDDIESVKQVFASDPAFLFDPNDFEFPDTFIVRVPEPNRDLATPEIVAIDLLIYKDGYSHEVIARRQRAVYGEKEFWFC